tara:strand:+ start:393 stop:503 length:111 start_codon:yes stop_codon:yes gene_type:complete
VIDVFRLKKRGGSKEPPLFLFRELKVQAAALTGAPE